MPFVIATATLPVKLVATFPLASCAVTTTPNPAPAVVLAGGSVVKASVAAAPGLTVTPAVWVMATALIVAETVLPSATVDVSTLVNTPLLLVVPLALGVNTLLEPVEATVTDAPLIRFPCASFAVTVIVLPVPPAVIEAGAAATVERLADTAPAVTVTAAVCVIATALIVADTVLASATVEVSVVWNTPLPLVVPLALGVNTLLEPVDATVTDAPLIRFPFASFAVTVIVLPVPPAVIVAGAAATVD